MSNYYGVAMKSETKQNDDGNDLVRTTLYLYRKHKDFLVAHPEINLSGYVRMKLDQDIEKEGK